MSGAVWAAVVFLCCLPACRLCPQVAVGPGQLQRQRWTGADRRWRTFCFDVPLSCAPCQLGLAVGPLAAEASTYVPKKASAGAAAGATDGVPQQQQQQPKQFTHFAPQQLPAELAVAAVLATPPSLNGRSDGKSGSSGTGGTGGKGGGSNGAGAASCGSLSRSAHFFSLAFSLFEELLGARFPLPAMQQASGVSLLA